MRYFNVKEAPIKVYGVQAAGAPGMYQSIKSGKIEALSSVSAIADGIAVKKPGDLTFEICSKYVDDIAAVTEDEICAAAKEKIKVL